MKTVYPPSKTMLIGLEESFGVLIWEIFRTARSKPIGNKIMENDSVAHPSKIKANTKKILLLSRAKL